jgi:ABC-type phosphate transport system ATPase subunit
VPGLAPSTGCVDAGAEFRHHLVVESEEAILEVGEAAIEVGATDKMFTNPAQKLTEDYVTGRFE